MNAAEALRLPPCLDWLRGSEAGAAWLAALPGLVSQAVERWALRIGEPYPNSYVSLVLPASLPDDTDAVLKLQFPHRESEHEATALARWAGDGAVRLLEHDPSNHCLLMERCQPGTHLSELAGDQALAVLIHLLPRLWKPVSAPFEALSSEAQRWADQLPRSWKGAGQPFERRLLEAALDTIETLTASQGEQVIGRLDRLTEELGLDRRRARGWAFAQTLAWCFESDQVLPHHLETARWLLESA